MSLFDALLDSEPLESMVEASPFAKELFIAIRSDGNGGRGTSADPFNGSGLGFDNVMKSLPTIGGQTVHLGPGVFFSRGTEDLTWVPSSGQRIVGSGVNATTLRLVLARPSAGKSYWLVGRLYPAEALDSFQISDLTIDCNLGGQPNTGSDSYPRIAVGAINLYGKNIVVRRVRVISFGTRTPIWDYGQTSPPDGSECFPISVAFAVPPTSTKESNCVVEDCIVTPLASQSDSGAKDVILGV